MNAPILLVGLGGIGSEIVDTVYEKLDEKARKNVAVHGFDTDINDIAKRKNLKGHMTQTSAAISVWKCINHSPEFKASVEAWFPAISLGEKGESKIGKKALTEGAGQIRAISRLAYYYSLKKNGMEKLQADIGRLFEVTGEEGATTPRVIIVTSLAGGTGAGIFLQAALYIRNQLVEKYGQDAFIMRGMFLLPDILIESRITQEDETADLRANAYASVKELNAIVSSATRNTNTTIDMEVEPGQEKLAIEASPYDSCFLLDYANIDKEHLGTGIPALIAYKKQAVNTLYLQIFSPIASNSRSAEDNLIRKNINSEGLNFYGSAGVSHLIYPYQDILDYCATRKVQQNLEGQWLFIDDRFREEMESYEVARANGEFRQEPVLGKFFTTQMGVLGGQGTNHPFFTPLYKSIQQLDQKGRPLAENKPTAFIRAVEEKVENTLKNNMELQGYIEELKDAPDAQNLGNRDSVMREVRETEDSLYGLKEYVLRVLIPETPNSILFSIIREDSTKENCLTTSEEFRLNTWILKKEKPKHPVAVRYFLYELEQQLEETIAELKGENVDTREIIDLYENVYDDIKTEGIVEDAEMIIQKALEQNRIKSFFGGKGSLKQQVETYKHHSHRMREALQRYAGEKILQEVFEKLLAGVQGLIREWEGFFTQLRGRQSDLEDRRQMLADKHDRNVDPTTTFIRGSRKEKEQIWSEISGSSAGQADSSSEMFGNLYCSIYQKFAAEQWVQSGQAVVKRELPDFCEEMVVWCRNELRGHNVIDVTLAKAARLSGVDSVELVKKSGRKAKPWLSVDPAADPRTFEYWGIHPENHFEQGGIDRQAFGDANVVQDVAFSPYELINYKALVGYRAEDLTKFKAKNSGGVPGVYFNAYQKKRKNYDRGQDKSCTHHLDRHWHLPAYMPDLNKEFAAINEEDRRSAFVYGLINRKMLCQMEDGKSIWYSLKAETMPRPIVVRGKVVEEGFYNLYEALNYNPGIVDTINESSQAAREDDLRNHKDDLRKHSFCKGSHLPGGLTIVDTILAFTEENPHLDLVNQQYDMLVHFGKMAGLYHRLCLGERRKNEADKRVKRFLQDIIRESDNMAALDSGRQELLKERILSAALKP